MTTPVPEQAQVERSVAQVQSAVMSAMTSLQTVESLPLHECLSRVLAQDLVSPINVPAHDNSAMDGFAIRGQDYLQGLREFTVIGKALAGKPSGLSVEAGQAVQITTGAVMPAGTDTVITQEVSVLSKNRQGDLVHLTLPEGQSLGQNRRFQGEDLQMGKAALSQGRILSAADIGLIASLGMTQVLVRPRLKVAIFSTGDELVLPGSALGEGQIYDSNRYTLAAMLTRLGAHVIDLGLVKDSPEALEATITQAASQADAIISSGGVSVGEADFTKTVMAKLGQVEFWRIAMRPGRPMAFGQVLGKPYFGLPGNPVAVMVTFYFFAREPLLTLAGATAKELPLFQARLSTPIRKRPGRTEYQRGVLSRAQDGQLEVRLTGQQGSGVLSSMSSADCFIVMHDQQGSVQQGEPVDCLAFHGLI